MAESTIGRFFKENCQKTQIMNRNTCNTLQHLSKKKVLQNSARNDAIYKHFLAFATPQHLKERFFSTRARDYIYFLTF